MPAISRMATPAESIHSAGDCSGCATPTARTRMLHGSRDLEEQVAAVTVIRRIHREESEAARGCRNPFLDLSHHGLLSDCSPIRELTDTHAWPISSSPTFSPCIDRISLLTRGRRPQSELKAMLAVAQKSRLCLSGNAASSMHPGRRPGNHCSVASLSEHGCDDKGSTTTMYCTWKRVCSSNRQPSEIIPRCAPSGAL